MTAAAQADRTELTVASYNIHKGVGTDRRRDLDRTASVIAELGADILALQEVDTRLGTRTGLLDLEALQRELGMVPVPLGNDGPAHGWHGNLILVRSALIETVRKIALPGLEPRGAIIADLGIGGSDLRVVAAHLGLLPSSRTAQARTLMDRIGMLDDRPALLMGDLNEWRSGAAAFRALAPRFATNGAAPSFPSRRPMLPLDRIMVCGKGELSGFEAHDSPLARRASDHLPVRARLHLPERGRDRAS